jgi:hypothetical protein
MTRAMDAERTGPFADVERWRARDHHTGIGKDVGVPYTYEHVEASPAAGAAVYRVETYIAFEEPTPTHRDVYYVPAALLNGFFAGWGGHATIVVDVRPLSVAEALEELRAFRSGVESAPSSPPARPRPAP